jgi:hypothetical protein
LVLFGFFILYVLLLVFQNSLMFLLKEGEDMQHLQGSVVSWTVPLRGSDGFTSTIDLANNDGYSLALHVTTPTLEEHVWLMRPGQSVGASDVVLDSLCEGRTRFCWVLAPPTVGGHVTRYEDLPVDAITGFEHHEGNVLCVFLGNGAQVKSVDTDKSRQLLDVGIGGRVLLYNVKVARRGEMFVTSGSGVKKIEREPDPVATLTPPPLLGPWQKPERWHCVVCLYFNYASKSVCRGCNLQRKQGPLPGNTWNFRFDSIPRRQFKRFPQWHCLACGHRNNFSFAQNDCCAKCKKKRVEKTKTKRQKVGK